MIHVLMVDEDPRFLELSRAFLEEVGEISVEPLNSPAKALDFITTRHYDAVVSEYAMQEMEGLVLLKAIREQDPDLPFIFFASAGGEEPLLEALNWGANAYLLRGRDPTARFPELLRHIHRWYGKAQKFKEIVDSEERFRERADQMPQPVFEMDREGNLIYVNEIGLEAFGFTADDLAGGMNAFALVAPKDRERAKENIWWSLRDIKMGENEYTALRMDGTTFPMDVFTRPILRDGEAVGLRGIAVDISKRRDAERALQESEERLSMAMASANLFVWDWDMKEGTVTYSTRIPGNESGKARMSNLVSGTWDDFIHPEDLPRLLKEAADHASGKSVGLDTECRLRWRDNRWIWIEIQGKVIERDDDSTAVKMTGVYQDITDKVRREKLLKGREAQFRTLFYRMNCGGTIFRAVQGGRDFVVTDINYAGEVIEGEKKASIVGKRIPEVYSLDAGRELHDAMSLVWKTGKPRSVPLMGFEKGGTKQWREYYLYILPSEEIIAIYNDISERITKQQQMLESLKIKETLIKEIHHRVKNNLQVIASILKLQSMRLDDQMALDALRDCRNRVFSIAMIHEELYRSENLSRINIAEYIKHLGDHLIYEFLSITPGISLAVECDDDITLDIDTGIPCGLIIDELITNALKYAFSTKNSGMIAIVFRKINERAYELVVRDNGVGFPETVDFKNTESLGMQLVNSLVTQLGGTIAMRRAGGTEFTITFPVMRA
jgi:PAS domain S-box-containing protein